MKLKNKIFNYFVAPPISGGLPRVVLSPVTMSSDIAKSLISRQLKKQNEPELSRGKLLHVCFDYDSERIYVPNADEFSLETLEPLLKAAEVRITKDFGGFSSQPPIKGSPFSSLRVRSLNSFVAAKKTISRHHHGKTFKDLPVLEVYLPRMPSTVKTLPEQFRNNDNFLGGYIGPDFANSITFVDEIDIDGRKRQSPIVLLTQATPFILINIAQTRTRKEPMATEKEWVVIGGYRDYLHDKKVVGEEKNISGDISQFADLYAIKQRLYMGWPLEEVSSFMLRSADTLPKLINGIDFIMRAVNSLKTEGYKDVADVPYYITFKIDETFPIDLSLLMNIHTGKIDTEKQYPNFLIIDYDKNNSYVLIECPVFISPDICTKIFKAKSTPFVSRYNSVVNTIDIKSLGKSYDELRRDRVQLAKIKGIVYSGLGDSEKLQPPDFRGGDLASGVSSVDPRVYNVRRVSDYLYASDYIKKMCEQAKLPFIDFNVVVGPIENALGSGVQGGFMDQKCFVESKIKMPFEIAKGVFISPPVILISSTEKPSSAEQTDTLIHEYEHYLFGLQNPDYKIGYDSKNRKGPNDYKYWYDYFQDANERSAHKRQIKFQLALGRSYDEIIRDKVGGRITTENYPLAIKFSEMVQEAVKELEAEDEINEKPVIEGGQNEEPVTKR